MRPQSSVSFCATIGLFAFTLKLFSSRMIRLIFGELRFSWEALRPFRAGCDPPMDETASAFAQRQARPGRPVFIKLKRADFSGLEPDSQPLSRRHLHFCSPRHSATILMTRRCDSHRSFSPLRMRRLLAAIDSCMTPLEDKVSAAIAVFSFDGNRTGLGGLSLAAWAGAASDVAAFVACGWWYRRDRGALFEGRDQDFVAPRRRCRRHRTTAAGRR